ncbi:MAG: xanthine dehydrogenase family protein subunit M [Dehalococcoidia bacterium]|nr:xanthine dehydrogenase family protein subunit M [Dehalococcoidia bacterium]
MKTTTTYTGFDYLKPKTLEEACKLIAKYKNARLLAGGTDLKVMMGCRGLMPSRVISLESVSDLNYITYDKAGLRIGALATMTDVSNAPVVREKFPMLAQATEQMGSPQIRNTATLIGNLCRAAPSADTAPPLIALGAKVKLVSASGERVIPLEQFFIGPGETVLRSDEILAEVQVSNPAPNTSGTYVRVSARNAMAIAIVGVAALVTMDAKRTGISDARIVLGAVAPTPIRATRAEYLLKGKPADAALIEKAAQAAAEASKPISDTRGTARYRREMVRVLVNQALKQVTGKA